MGATDNDFNIIFHSKAFFMIRYANYSWREIFSLFQITMRVFILALPIPILTYYYVDATEWSGFLFQFIVIILNTSLVILFVGIERKTRIRLLNVIINRLYNENFK